LKAFFFACGVETLISAGHLPRNEFVWNRLAPSLVERESGSAQKLMEVDAVQNTQRDDLLDVPWWCRQRFIV
jgi:hypothetical protein